MMGILNAIGLLVVLALNYVLSDTCVDPRVDAVGFTTQDATIVTKIAYIADFSLTCANGAKDISLYAETTSSIVGVARTVDGLRYQVSWIEDVSKAASGVLPVKLYDEQGYAALRKAQRSGEEKSGVQPLATIDLYHPGAYTGPWIQSETMAVIAAVLIYYYAYSERAIIMA